MPTSLDIFPESLFLPSPIDFGDYMSRMNIGLNRMADSRVVIVGLARDVGRVLKLTIARIEQLRSMFRQSSVVIFENDSRDNTIAMLEAWQAKRQHVHILSQSLGHPVNISVRSLARASRMAYYRAQCQEFVADKYGHADCVIIVDTDLDGGFSYDGIANTFGYDFHCMASNGLLHKDMFGVYKYPVHYDVWALRWRNSWDPLENTPVNQLRYCRGEEPVRVNSAFGGLGVYTLPAYLAGKYDGTDCEHVPFHRSMMMAGFDQMFLNPSQITLYNYPQ